MRFMRFGMIGPPFQELSKSPQREGRSIVGRIRAGQPQHKFRIIRFEDAQLLKGGLIFMHGAQFEIDVSQRHQYFRSIGVAPMELFEPITGVRPMFALLEDFNFFEIIKQPLRK
jgi:hypothetical protein